MFLRIHRYLPLTAVEGPGKRFCLWVQGCPIRCKGCGVPWTWNENGGELISIEQLFEEIRISKEMNQIEGVTFLGGEPFEQAEALACLGKMVKNIDLSIMTFSGYTYENLLKDMKDRKGWQELLNVTDLLVDGPFEQENLDLSRPWMGSSNQQYRFLTDRYKYLENNMDDIKNKIEIRIEDNGKILINGMATQGQLKSLTSKLAKRIQ